MRKEIWLLSYEGEYKYVEKSIKGK